MINKSDSICLQSSVWDLHIHSCNSPKSSGEFQKLSVDEYIKLLDSIFKQYPDLKMISFTDHNLISKEVYQAAISKKWNITIIIGIEVDTFLDEDGKTKNDLKHIIYYFDPKKFDLEKHSRAINEKLKSSPVLLSDFLNFLVTEIKVPFLISPHFMKQDKRGIEFRWDDEEEIRKNIDKYIDQMFCFWETSSAITIHRALQYLKDFDRENRVSIISFSDSSSKEKLEHYLNNPHQYFNALPTFDGIRMVGSDVRRISNEKITIKKDNFSSFIGKIVQGDSNEIYLSNKLNAVIGGRGTGKSLLIDGIAFFLNPKTIINNDQTKDRADYLKKLDYKVYDLNGNLLDTQNFKFEYFNQGYVINLFKSNDDDRISNLYLKDEFSSLEEYDINSVRERIKEDIAYQKTTTSLTQENLVSLCEKIIILDDKDLNNLFKKEKEMKVLAYPDLNTALSTLSKSSIVPPELKENKEIIKKQLELLETIYSEINKYNSVIIKNNFYSSFFNSYAEILSNKNELAKEKRKTIKLLEANFNNTFIPIINRVARINSIIKNKNNYSDKRTLDADGFDRNKFTFSRELNVQPLLEYLHTVFCSFFDKTKVFSKFKINRDDVHNLPTLINIYCYYPDDFMQSSKKIEELDEELNDLSSLKIVASDEVYYFKNGCDVIKLRDVSPGTKANLLMEYIVFKQSSVPLLIDQPEDNIDNKTIYNDLTNWFNSLKKKRQVIVATHDANIVVNSDAENIIVCDQTSNNVFNYINGALEFDGIINDVSTILDGGRDALERRLTKYGKTN